ncbi:hypothetical protein DPMN_157208 [Dreissena polymorpha]|uniref:Uncharacterized protein n=1 Tax=Dreissena polymorpha TaxID=45954 RepID=A0A9D4IM21_DREPO|nr:hypothetical protein DPMN_157208 [Dreissena polymorpha]
MIPRQSTLCHHRQIANPKSQIQIMDQHHHVSVKRGTRIQVSHLKRHARQKKEEKALQLKSSTF